MLALGSGKCSVSWMKAVLGALQGAVDCSGQVSWGRAMEIASSAKKAVGCGRQVDWRKQVYLLIRLQQQSRGWEQVLPGRGCAGEWPEDRGEKVCFPAARAGPRAPWRGRQGSHSGEQGLSSADSWEVGACRARRFEVRVSGVESGRCCCASDPLGSPCRDGL